MAFTIGNLKKLARSGTPEALTRIKRWCKLVGIEVSGRGLHLFTFCARHKHFCGILSVLEAETAQIKLTVRSGIEGMVSHPVRPIRTVHFEILPTDSLKVRPGRDP
jgi:hypothetical protein